MAHTAQDTAREAEELRFDRKHSVRVSPASLTLPIVATLGAALLGSAFPPDRWFEQLNKPADMPPGAAFGIAWSVLYVLIAAAGVLVFSDRRRGKKLKALWIAQIILNAAWTPLFFGAHRPDWALSCLVVLLAVSAAFTVGAFYKRPTAGWLFLPYVLWLSFALMLNVDFIALNAAAVESPATSIATYP